MTLPHRFSMGRSTIALAATLVLAAAAGASFLQHQREGAPPRLPTAPVSVDGVLYARSFHLQRPYTHRWRAEQPSVDRGLILVLAAKPGLLVPRQGLESVLLLGDQTVERVNRGDGSGHLIVLVPDSPGAPGNGAGLAGLRAWFAAPALPEEVDAAWIAVERSRADAVPVLGPSAAAALERNGDPLLLVDRLALEHFAAELILLYAPDESEHAAGLTVPLIR